MTIYNLGSINADYFYRVPHIVSPGETLAAMSLTKGIGGKGANQSVAMMNAGASVVHIGAVGSDGNWILEQLNRLGLQTQRISISDYATGHAIICVADDGENAITLFPGANQNISQKHIEASLANIGSDDWLVLQNETNNTVFAAAFAKKRGARVAYSAAPFDINAVKEMLNKIDLLAVNEGEAKAVMDALGADEPSDIPVPMIMRTLGKQGAELWIEGEHICVQGMNVKAIDTTGAGDTFFGYLLGQLSLGVNAKKALNLANAAAALKVTKPGTADVIPKLEEVRAFMA